jgi:hypothetical protein
MPSQRKVVMCLGLYLAYLGITSALSVATSWWTQRMIKSADINVYYHVILIMLLSTSMLAMVALLRRSWVRLLVGTVVGEFCGAVALMISPLCISWAAKSRLYGIEHFGVWHSLLAMLNWNLVVGGWVVGGASFLLGGWALDGFWRREMGNRKWGLGGQRRTEMGTDLFKDL